MTIPTWRQMARGSSYVAYGLNAGIAAADVVRGQGGAAAVQAIACLVVAGGAALLEAAIAMLETQTAKWAAERDSAILVRDDLLRQKADFEAARGAQAATAAAAGARRH